MRDKNHKQINGTFKMTNDSLRLSKEFAKRAKKSLLHAINDAL